MIVVAFLVSLEFVFSIIFLGLDDIFYSAELVESNVNKRIVNEVSLYIYTTRFIYLLDNR